KATAIWPPVHGNKDLRSDNHLVPVGVILERSPENFLAIAIGIGIGRIEKINPQIQRFFDDRAAALFIQRPFIVYPALRLAKTHTAQADRRYVQSGISEFYIFHA